MEHGREHEDHVGARDELGMFALSLEEVHAGLGTGAVVADGTSHAKGNLVANALEHDASGQNALPDGGRDSPTAPDGVDGGEMIAVTLAHRAALLEIHPERGSEEGLLDVVDRDGVSSEEELNPPHSEKHDRIRIWANGRWEYMVPSQRFGPGVYMAHRLAEFWPDDTIGIIKVASGGTGIRGFEKNWSFERSERTFDGKKGSLYQNLMHAVAEAREISNPEFCGFVWRQTKADGTKRDLAEE
jgi:hypothetical protein